jgi:uncharacterized RDD family membrane protein YckC
MTDNNHSAFPRAGLLRRLAALLYDGFLVAAIWMLIGFCIQFIAGPDTNKLIDGVVQTNPLVDAVTFSLMVLSASGFYIWFWSRSGQTLGMVSWRLKTLRTDNQLLTIPQAALRFFLAWPAFFLLGAGYFWMYVDKDKDALHDRLSKSKVVLVPKSHRPFN